MHVRLRPLDESQEQGVVVIDYFTSGVFEILTYCGRIVALGSLESLPMFVYGSLAKYTPRSCCRRPRVLLLYHQHMPRIIHLLGPVTKRHMGSSLPPEHCQESIHLLGPVTKRYCTGTWGIFFTRTLPRIHAPARSSYKKIVLSTATIYIYMLWPWLSSRDWFLNIGGQQHWIYPPQNPCVGLGSVQGFVKFNGWFILSKIPVILIH